MRFELRCSGDLARWLGAISPGSMIEHRMLRDSGFYLLIRDRQTARPHFWLWAFNVADEIRSRSS